MNIATTKFREGAEPLILLVDGEGGILLEYPNFVELEGYDSAICSVSGEVPQMVFDPPSVGLTIADLRMTNLDGASLIWRLPSAFPRRRLFAFIILTDDATSQCSDDIAIIARIKQAIIDKLVTAIKSVLA